MAYSFMPSKPVTFTSNSENIPYSPYTAPNVHEYPTSARKEPVETPAYLRHRTAVSGATPFSAARNRRPSQNVPPSTSTTPFKSSATAPSVSPMATPLRAPTAVADDDLPPSESLSELPTPARRHVPSESATDAREERVPAHLPEEKDERWVTVFGFTPPEREHVLDFMRSCGEVLDTRFPSVSANKMHVCFGDKFQAKTALRKNGEELTETLMIGVVPYKDTPLKKRPHEGEPAKRDIHKGAARAVHAAGNKEYSVELPPRRGPSRIFSCWRMLKEYVLGF